VTTPQPHTLVIGGTRGIGRTVARCLAADGDIVSIVGRSRPSWVDDRSNVRAWTADVGNAQEFAATLTDVARETGSVTSAVLLQRYRGSGDDWAGEIATSLTATRQLLEWAGEHFEDRGRGKAVVVVSSIAGMYVASEQPVSYHMAKAAITQLVRYFAVTLGGQRVRVNAISPGTIVKDEAKPFYQDHPDLEQLYRDIIPLGRMGTADDVAQLAQFLLSDRASFLTGQNIVLDGGVSLQAPESLARHVSPLKDLQVSRPKTQKV
jgi:NAD(P)-dependent dehydrogenase (short-subunit alcohol dehydrogenase family)